MSSPSKIPRPRFGEKKQTIAAVGKVYNEKHAPKMEHSSGMPTKLTRLVKPKVIKSPLREIPENKNKQKNQKEHKNSVINDRRGISEIKRSEHNLRVKVDSLEIDLISMKQELSTVKSKVEAKSLEVANLKEKSRDSEILIAKLEEEKKINSHILEKFNFDPVTKIKLDPTEEFESLLMMQKKSKQSELNLILNVFEEQMCKLGSRLDEI